MLKTLPESRDQFLGFAAQGQITLEDFRQSLLPRLEAVINDWGAARMLLLLQEDFEGLDPEAINSEASGTRLREALEKIAVVGGSWWFNLQIRLAAATLAGEVQTFAREELAEAWVWVKA